MIQTTDWFQVITQLMTAGIPMTKIGAAMGVEISDKMLGHYRAGTEPLHWRGEKLLTFWCLTLGKDREQRPMRDVVRGRYRASIVTVRPSHISNHDPNWYAGAAKRKAEPPKPPDPEPVAAATARKKPGPKPGSKRNKAAEVV